MSIPSEKRRWTWAAAALASAILTAAFGAGFSAMAQQAPAVPSRFVQPDPIDFNDHDGWTQIFDGKTLNGWDGPPDVWHVEDGAIVGESSPEHPSGTTNIIWRGGEVGNFMLKVEMKLEGSGANGGIQYRSLNVPPGRARFPRIAWRK